MLESSRLTSIARITLCDRMEILSCFNLKQIKNIEIRINTVECRFSKRKFSKETGFSKDFDVSHFSTNME